MAIDKKMREKLAASIKDLDAERAQVILDGLLGRGDLSSQQALDYQAKIAELETRLAEREQADAGKGPGKEGKEPAKKGSIILEILGLED